MVENNQIKHFFDLKLKQLFSIKFKIFNELNYFQFIPYQFIFVFINYNLID